jgi:hypothetical protein
LVKPVLTVMANSDPAMKELDDLPPLIPIKDLKKYGAFMPGKTTANKLMKKGILKARKLGRLTFIEKASLVAYVTDPKGDWLLRDLRDVL